jgi:hypothetical protein
MNGVATASSSVVFSDPNWSVSHLADVNGDTKSDLVWRNAATGATAIWLMNGTTSSSGTTILADPNWSVAPPDGR